MLVDYIWLLTHFEVASNIFDLFLCVHKQQLLSVALKTNSLSKHLLLRKGLRKFIQWAYCKSECIFPLFPTQPDILNLVQHFNIFSSTRHRILSYQESWTFGFEKIKVTRLLGMGQWKYKIFWNRVFLIFKHCFL